MIFLVRHGESTWNVRGLVQGSVAHPPLTALGRTQVAGAAALLAGRGVSRIVTSDLARAVESAAVLAEALGVPVRVDVRLREQALGRLEGLASASAFDALGDVDWDDPDLRLGGGESPRAVHDRMAAAVTDAGDGTLLVSHGDAIRAALGWWQGHPPPAPWTSVPPAAVFVLEPGGLVRELLP